MTNTTPELKECFYCTGTAERYGAKLHHGIQCIYCGVQVSMCGSTAKEEIVCLWNGIIRDAAEHKVLEDDGLMEAIKLFTDPTAIRLLCAEKEIHAGAGGKYHKAINTLIAHASRGKVVEVTKEDLSILIAEEIHKNIVPVDYTEVGNAPAKAIAKYYPNGIKIVDGH